MVLSIVSPLRCLVETVRGKSLIVYEILLSTSLQTIVLFYQYFTRFPVVFDYWFRWRSVLPLQSALHLKHLHIWRMLSNGIEYVTSYVMTNIEVVTIAIQSLCSLICSVICVYEMCVSYALSTCLQRFSCFSPWSEDIRVTVQESGDNNLHAGSCYWCAYICLQFSICPFCIVTLVNYY